MSKSNQKLMRCILIVQSVSKIWNFSTNMNDLYDRRDYNSRGKEIY